MNQSDMILTKKKNEIVGILTRKGHRVTQETVAVIADRGDYFRHALIMCRLLEIE